MASKHKIRKGVCLIVPPTRTYSTIMPLGILSLSAYLESKHIENYILDFKMKEDMQAMGAILDSLKLEKPRIIATSCMCTEIEHVIALCTEIKKILPYSKIIVGGPHPTNFPEVFSSNNCFDYIVIGEGEITFYELCSLLIKKKSPSDDELFKIKGIAWKKNISDKRPLLENLDDLPIPAYHKIDMEYYAKPNSWIIRPVFISVASIFTSRGCPYRCRFCTTHAVFGKRARNRSIRLILQEIKLLLNKYKFDAISFSDDTFTVNKEYTKNLCRAIIKNNMKFIWGCETRANLVDEELLKLMRDAGCIQVDFGIETCSPRLLKVIQKDITVGSIEKALLLCRNLGIRTFVNMMTNLPTETIEDLNMSIVMMKRLKPNVIVWNVTIPYPGTNLDIVIDNKDLELFNRFSSSEIYTVLDNKYKICKYKAKFNDIVFNRLYKTFFHPKKPHLILTQTYIGSFFRFIDFIFDAKYIKQILRSRRKVMYLKEFFKITPSLGKPSMIKHKSK
ncbi:MAG: radical SAM protein [archaeon]